MNDTVSARQIKAARAILGWRRQDLASRAGMSPATVKVVETDEDALPALAPTRARLVKVLEAAGIRFLLGSAPGVQLIPAEEGLRAEDLNASNDD
ncbi:MULTISPECIES: helix-turn-helix transcriptional regulator [unclassified Xanthobacter]|uniref:helix-turn-helix domain-containing protein n=1 Tax=unclassified Xanthobacter TaxID=2623496 RepID=UPI001F1F38C2|nr:MULTISPECIES: helix-turn-helix transcriptional regulator [unclassified Xanthobacter]